MKNNFAELLAEHREFFPEELITGLEFNNLLNVARLFPQQMTPGVGFESRLWHSDPTLDLFFCLEKETRSSMGLPKTLDFETRLFEQPDWRKILNFCKEWSKPSNLQVDEISRIFFEFDLDKPVSTPPIPAIFLQFRSKEKNESISCGDLMQLLGSLNEEPPSEKVRKNVQLCHKHLIPGSIIDHVGMMLSRSPRVIRLNINPLNHDQLCSYLESIGLGYRKSEINGRLRRYSKFVDSFVLCLDVGEEVSSKIGVELRHDKEDLELKDQERWTPFLEYLSEEKLCLPAKKNGLMAWSGRSRDIYHPYLYRYIAYRFINYFKVVFEPQKPEAVKAYFSLVFKEIE